MIINRAIFLSLIKIDKYKPQIIIISLNATNQLLKYEVVLLQNSLSLIISVCEKLNKNQYSFCLYKKCKHYFVTLILNFLDKCFHKNIFHK